jgi:cell division protein FtsQ
MRSLSPTDIISRAASAVPEHARRTRKMREAAVERAALRQTPLPLPMPTSRTGLRVAGRVRPAPRRRLSPFLTRRRALWLAALLVLIGGPTWLATAGHLDPLAAAAHRQAIALSRGLGMTVSEVLVEGRERTSQKELRDALAVDRGAAILDVDLAAVRIRLQALPWVRDAVVERRLPDAIYVQLTERLPIARIRDKGKFALVDRDGEVLRIAVDDSFAKLPLVAGAGAAADTPQLIGLLSEQPALAKRVTLARRIGERRWDLTFDSGVVLRLPEELPSLAWARFAEIEKLHSLLDRGLVAIDLRLKDRIGLVTPTPIEKPSKRPGKNT